MPVVLLLAYGIAVLLDGALGNGIRLLKRGPHVDEDESWPACRARASPWSWFSSWCWWSSCG